ncbi:hypothetical protein ACKUB1_12550 [Methanospirillum stamsii]|uniref:Uncharacterized protein n=1 Tax=Methanospirillum stamsii TaxID=1277351 RepID=A0A2V2N920_9EURY|nr:hypothetical protein [Methanospirillum stamsii]PWR76339.1 hypothetical protein DLD82_00585 [Methanospirillum stamsii]
MTKKDDLLFLSTITDDQARRVLTLLLQENPKLISKATAIAKDLLSGTDEEEISESVCDALSDLDVHVLWEESGKTYHGYVDPYEHSYEMMEDKIEPFLDDMERYLDRNMVDDAFSYCKGIMKGICVYMSEEAGEFADWAVDSDDGLTYDVIERWKTKNNNPDIITGLEAWRKECLKMKSR